VSEESWNRLNRAKREPKEGEPGLWLATELVGAPERFLGGVEVTEAAADLADLVEGHAGVEDVDVAELGIRAPRLLLGLGPITAQLEHLGAMHAAEPGERRHRMPLRPPGTELGPLGRALVVAELLARADQTAIDLAGLERVQLALDREEHRFVVVGETFGGTAAVDQQPADRLESVGLEVAVTDAACDVERALRQHHGVVDAAL